MYLITIAPGANLFIIIVAILLAAGAGLTATDFLKTKARDKEMEELDKNSPDQGSSQSVS